MELKGPEPKHLAPQLSPAQKKTVLDCVVGASRNGNSKLHVPDKNFLESAVAETMQARLTQGGNSPDEEHMMVNFAAGSPDADFLADVENKFGPADGELRERHPGALVILVDPTDGDFQRQQALFTKLRNINYVVVTTKPNDQYEKEGLQQFFREEIHTQFSLKE